MSRDLFNITQELNDIAEELSKFNYLKEASDLHNVSDMIRTGANQRIRKTASLPSIPTPTKHLIIPSDKTKFFELMKHLSINVPDWRGKFPGVEYLLDCMGDFEEQLRQRGYKDYSLED